MQIRLLSAARDNRVMSLGVVSRFICIHPTWVRVFCVVEVYGML